MLSIKTFEEYMHFTNDETINFVYYKRKGKILKLQLFSVYYLLRYFFLNEKDPFERLNICFKNNDAIKIDLNFERSLFYSLTFILYQIIEFSLSSMNEEEIGILYESA
jgi:hypothetical protein